MAKAVEALAPEGGLPQSDRMAKATRPVIIIRVLALVSVALAIMCASLAWAWQSEREKAACWRVAAEFQTQREDGCRE